MRLPSLTPSLVVVCLLLICTQPGFSQNGTPLQRLNNEVKTGYIRTTSAILPASCTSAGISAALAALPASGGTVDASGCQGNVFLGDPGPIMIGASSNQPETLILGTGYYTCAMSSGNCFQINGSGSQLIGQASNNTFIGCAPGFTGDFVHIEPALGANAVSGVNIKGFTIRGTDCPRATQLNVLSVEDPSEFSDLDLRFGTGTALNVGVSTNAGAQISQGLNFANVYVQSGPGTLTNDLVKVVDCNQCYFGPNFKVIAVGPEGPFVAMRMRSVNGNNRGNHFFDGAVAQETPTGTCLVLDASTSSATGPQGNVIGPAVTFENCGLGILLTGANLSSRSDGNTVEFNYWLHDTAQIELDFAVANNIYEQTSGAPGDITFTRNSSSNYFSGRLVNARTDISDAGAANAISTVIDDNGSNLYSLQGLLAVSGPFSSAGGGQEPEVQNYLNFGVARGGATGIAAADRVYLEALSTSAAVSFGHILFYVVSPDPDSLHRYSIGVYDAKGDSVCTTAPAPYISAGDQRVACSQGTVSLPAGKYYLMFTGDAASLKIAQFSGADSAAIYSNSDFDISAGGSVPTGTPAFTPPQDVPETTTRTFFLAMYP